MKFNPSNTLLAAVAASVLLTGCGSSGIGGVLGGGNDSGRTTDNSTYDPYGQRANEVQGTVERVNARDRYVVVDVEASRYNLRNGNGNDDEVTLYYDDRTDVEFEGKTYQPQDLEPGDRIRADVDSTGSRLLAEQIEVLHDVTGGGNSDSTGVLGGYDDDDDYRNDRNDDYNLAEDLRGTVRYIDTRDRTLEIEPVRNSRFTTGSSRADVIVVHYDAQTVVEFEGKRYTPDNLERGDEVEVDVRDLNGRLMAEEIVVVRDSRDSIGR